MADLSQIPTNQLVAMLGQHPAVQAAAPAPQPAQLPAWAKQQGVTDPMAGGQGSYAGTAGALTNAPGVHELGAAIAATEHNALPFLTGKPTNWNKDYSDVLAASRAASDTYNTAHPVLGALASALPTAPLAGGLGTVESQIPAKTSQTVGQILKGVATRAAVQAEVGAALGAPLGFASGRGGFENRVASAGKGALEGAVLGGGTSLAVDAIGGLTSAGKNLISAFGDNAPETTVGKMLARAAGGTVPASQEAPLPGMQPTAGQATGNQGLLYLERSAEQATPEGARLAASNRAASNGAIMDAVQKIGDVNSPASEKMLDALEEARDSSRRTYQVAWKQAGIDDTTPLNVAPLKQDIQGYIDGLTRSGKSKIPSDIGGVFQDFGDTEPLREIQDWRSDLSTAIRAARKNGDVNGMRILGGLSDKVDDFLDNGPTHRPDLGFAGPSPTDQLTEEEQARYNLARTATRVHKETFAAPGSPVTTALNPKEFGTSAESNTANLFIRPASSAGAPEAFASYMKAIKGTGDPAQIQAGYQAARDAFAQKFRDAITGVPDATGQPTIKAAAVSKFMDNYDHVINSELFTNDQRDLLDRINQAAQMTARTARGGAPGGSDTFAKLAGKNWVDTLVGSGAKKIARTVGAAAGYATGGPIGAAAGAYGAPKIMETMLTANKQATTNLLTQALYDPVLAKTLMAPATVASAKAIPLPIQARIYSALLGSKTANDNLTSKVTP